MNGSLVCVLGAGDAAAAKLLIWRQPVYFILFFIWQAEGTRSLREYMSLPPSEYSVLDADKVTRLDVNLFKYVSSLNVA
jgi:hypothetical protein